MASSKAISVKELEQSHHSSECSRVAEWPVWERVWFEGWGGKLTSIAAPLTLRISFDLFIFGAGAEVGSVISNNSLQT